MREYNKRPEVIERKRLWHIKNAQRTKLRKQTPEERQKAREYAMRPDQKLKRQQRQNTKEYKDWQRNYRKENPEKYYDLSVRHHKKYGTKLNMDDKSYKWKLLDWSKTVRKRDGYKCQVCGSVDRLLAHHLIHKQFYPELSLNLNNGITLCKMCHLEVHGGNFNI